MMMQSWMGSDFTNDDLVQESSLEKDYTHKLAGEATIDGRPCWKIILTPKPECCRSMGKDHRPTSARMNTCSCALNFTMKMASW